MPRARKLAQNPANYSQSMVLWSDGRIVAKGGAPDPGVNLELTPDRGVGDLAWDLQITDWVEPSGYIIDGWGTIHNFGTAAPVTGETFTFGINQWRRLFMDPAGNGAGYQVNKYGRFERFGGAPNIASVIGVSIWISDVLRDVHMDYATKKIWILDYWGGVHLRNGASGAGGGPYWPGFDIAKGIYIADVPTGAGYILDGWGGRHEIGGAPAINVGRPYWPGHSYGRDLIMSTEYPGILRYTVLDLEGVVWQTLVSDPPTATVTAPAEGSTVTANNAPEVRWEYNDPDRNFQALAEVKVFTAAQYGAAGFNPTTSAAYWRSTTDVPYRRGLQIGDTGTPLGIQLPNGIYRAYVRVTDAAGDISAWDNNQFTITVPAFNIPTLTRSTTNSPPFETLTVTVVAGDIGKVLQVEFSDDDWVTSYPVRGSGVVTTATVNTFYDYEIPLLKTRKYRARLYVAEPTNRGDWSTVGTNTGAVTVDHWLSVAENAAATVRAIKISEISLEKVRKVGVKWPIGRTTAVTSSTGAKGVQGSISVWAKSEAERLALEAMLDDGRPLCYRDTYGRVLFLSVAGNISLQHQRAIPVSGDRAGVRDFHSVEIPVVQVDRPKI